MPDVHPVATGVLIASANYLTSAHDEQQKAQAAASVLRQPSVEGAAQASRGQGWARLHRMPCSAYLGAGKGWSHPAHEGRTAPGVGAQQPADIVRSVRWTLPSWARRRHTVPHRAICI